MLLLYRDHPYRHVMGWGYFGRPWAEAKSEATYRQLPMLVTKDGTRITQTGAIMRYLAGRLDLMPADPVMADQSGIRDPIAAKMERARPARRHRRMPVIRCVVGVIRRNKMVPPARRHRRQWRCARHQ